jgi:hypothetical protein
LGGVRGIRDRLRLTGISPRFHRHHVRRIDIVLPIGDIARDAEHVGFMIDHLRRMVTDPLELYIASKEESAEGITCALFTRVFGSSGLFADDEEVPSFSPARPTIGRVWVKTDSGYVLRA